LCQARKILSRSVDGALLFPPARCTLRPMAKHIKPILRSITLGLTALLVLGLGLGLRGFLLVTPAQAQQWESSIRKFEEMDKLNPPKPGVIVFTGSSSIVRWDTLVDDMKPLTVINRAFGGSQYSDVNQFAKRIVTVYRPSAVVVYAGDNDLAENSPKTPETVAGDVRQFVQIVHSDLPDTWIYVLSIKPSKLRWKQWPNMKAANQMIQEFLRTQQRVQYLDVATPMFNGQGNLPEDLFVTDGLHPTPKCYAIWTSIIKPALLKRFGPKANVSRRFEIGPWLTRRDGSAATVATRRY
jgi:lysophospholipase L1-like esterase